MSKLNVSYISANAMAKLWEDAICFVNNFGTILNTRKASTICMSNESSVEPLIHLLANTTPEKMQGMLDSSGVLNDIETIFNALKTNDCYQGNIKGIGSFVVFLTPATPKNSLNMNVNVPMIDIYNEGFINLFYIGSLFNTLLSKQLYSFGKIYITYDVAFLKKEESVKIKQELTKVASAPQKLIYFAGPTNKKVIPPVENKIIVEVKIEPKPEVKIEPKVEEVKPVEPKVEPKPVESKVEEPKPVEPKPVEPKPAESKVEEPKREQNREQRREQKKWRR